MHVTSAIQQAFKVGIIFNPQVITFNGLSALMTMQWVDGARILVIYLTSKLGTVLEDRMECHPELFSDSTWLSIIPRSGKREHVH